MRLKATCNVWYAGKERKLGEEFDVAPGDETNARILIGIGKAAECKSEEPAKKIESEQEKPHQDAPEEEPEPSSPRRRYPRRDMRAEK